MATLNKCLLVFTSAQLTTVATILSNMFSQKQPLIIMKALQCTKNKCGMR